MADEVPIFPSIHTKKDAQLLLHTLSWVSAELFKVNANLESLLNQVLPEHQKRELLSFAQQKGIRIDDPLQFQRMIGVLKDYFSMIPTITLTVGIDPPYILVQKISQWVMENLHRTYFLDFQYDPSLIAGVIVTSGGSFRDYSLRAYLGTKSTQE